MGIVLESVQCRHCAGHVCIAGKAVTDWENERIDSPAVQQRVK